MLRPVLLPADLTQGKLYLCSMPGRFERLEVFIGQVADAQIGNILCLVSDEEISRKSPDYLKAIERDEIPAKLWRRAIPDYGLPDDLEELTETLGSILECLNGGESVVIHCAAGHGRTGLIAALLLCRMGLPLDRATELVRQAGSGADTREQQDFLERFGKRLSEEEGSN